MADFIFNRALGRAVEWYNNVKSNTPANSALVIMVLATSGLESDAVLKDKDTFADIVSGTTNEVTNAGYARIVLTDVELAAYAPDDTNDRTDLDIPDPVWGSGGTGPAAGDGWSRIVVGYDSDTTGGTDANIIPISSHDYVITPDGSQLNATVPAAGFFRAQ